MTAPDTATRIVNTDALQRGVANLKQRGANVNEATTRSVLVDSVLDALGYRPRTAARRRARSITVLIICATWAQ